MNIAVFGQKFFIFSGFLLLGVAAVQLLSRPRGKAKLAGWLDARTLRAIFFGVMGILTLLAGVGVIPLPGAR
jgi:hypothetical protein